MNPAITAAIVGQHHRDLITQAGAGRPARAARQSRSRRPASPVMTTKRVVTTAAAACAAAAVLMLAPAGPAHASAHHFSVPTVGVQMHYLSHRSHRA